MKKFLFFAAVVLFSTAPISVAATPERAASVSDTAAKVENADQRLRPLSACLWEKNRAAALDLSGQYRSSVMNENATNDQYRYRLNRGMFADCGGESALNLAVLDIGALAGDVNNIRVNQLARCILANNPEAVFSGIEMMIKKNGRVVGDRSSGRQVELVRIFMSGVRLPQPIPAAVTKCDASSLAFVDFNGATRGIFVAELDYEGKR